MKINVVGTSGSGKTTFSRQLAEQLDVPYIEIDALFWKADWQESSDREFFNKLEVALAQDSWVLDGNYTRTIPIKWSGDITVIWLDYSFARTLFQAISRALHRANSGQELWAGTGNAETFKKSFFSTDSIILWTIRSYHANRSKYLAMQTSTDYPNIKFVQLRSPKQAQHYLTTFHQS